MYGVIACGVVLVTLAMVKPSNPPPLSTPEWISQNARSGDRVRMVVRQSMVPVEGKPFVFRHHPGLPTRLFPHTVEASFVDPVPSSVPTRSVVSGRVWRVVDGVVIMVDCHLEGTEQP